jgi:hypothetical protein
MILEHSNLGGNFPKPEPTDTEKLPDVEALILEKSEELRLICSNARRQCLIMVDAKGEENGVGTSFWSFLMKKGDFQNPEDKNRFMTNFINMINAFLFRLSEGHFRILHTPPYVPPKEF